MREIDESTVKDALGFILSTSARRVASVETTIALETELPSRLQKEDKGAVPEPRANLVYCTP